jgi:hypothetical protein
MADPKQIVYPAYREFKEALEVQAIDRAKHVYRLNGQYGDDEHNAALFLGRHWARLYSLSMSFGTDFEVEIRDVMLAHIPDWNWGFFEVTEMANAVGRPQVVDFVYPENIGRGSGVVMGEFISIAGNHFMMVLEHGEKVFLPLYRDGLEYKLRS